MSQTIDQAAFHILLFLGQHKLPQPNNKKFANDTEIDNDIELSTKFPDSWAILIDK